MKRLLKYTTIRVLRNPNVISWGILFTLFWGVIGAYLMAPSFAKQIPPQFLKIAYQGYVGAWYADLVILSLASIATSITFVLLYQSGTLPYLIRYSKLKVSGYLTSIYLGTLAAAFIIELIMTAIVTLMFSNNGLGIQVQPLNVYFLVPLLIIGCVFFTSFSTFLALITVKLNLVRLNRAIAFLPLILGFLTFALFTYSTVSNSILYYTSPFSSLILLLYYAYTNSLTLGLTEFSVDVNYLLLSLILWIVALSYINLLLSKRIYFISVEEERAY